MVFEALHNQTSIIGAAMNGLSVRTEVINNNIANADTPGFKKSAVSFELALDKAVADFKRTGVLDLSGVAPSITQTHQNFSYRIDGNNVDIELEMADLYQTQMRYEALANGITNYYRRINSVFSQKM